MMKTGSKHQSAEMRRQQILAAAELVLIQVGIDDFTIDQVAGRAKIAKGTIYKYFKSKDEILSEISVKAASMLLESFRRESAVYNNSVDKLKAICRASYQYSQTHALYYELLAHIERPDFAIDVQEYIRVSRLIVDFCEQVVIQGQQNGEINPALNPQLLVRVIWASNIGVIQFVKTKQKLIRNIQETPQEEIIELSILLMTGGIYPNT